MAKPTSQLFLFLLLKLYTLLHLTLQDRSVADISALGYEFIPADTSYPPLFTFTVKKQLYCYTECNKRIDCRTFDYDDTTKQCRLWEGDTTTGSIVLSSSKPQSSVGTIRLSPGIYTNMHNQTCDKCSLSRYEVCSTNTNTCQCPMNTLWNGSMCLLQLFRNQVCSKTDDCRPDFNLTCQPSCDLTYHCSDIPEIGVGQTVAGYCNGTIGSDSTGLSSPWGIYVSPIDGTLYVADWIFNRFHAYPTFSRTGSILLSNGVVSGLDIFVDSSGLIYMTAGGNDGGTVYVQKDGVVLWSFPDPGQSTSSCLPTGLYTAHSITVDRSGNAYVSLYSCYAVVKWPPNGTQGTVVAGQLGVPGSTSDKLGSPRLIYLDDDRNALYVSDFTNHRIQKFIIGGNGIGVTVAGTGVAGTGLNQLNAPASVCVTRDGQTLYVSDYGNNRIMKWTLGDSEGSLVAGNINGMAGSTDQLLYSPAGLALDPSETYLYVADMINHRVQRFRLQ